ncbi:MAG TPA: vWA domain-containing protein, partial [Tepidisphaeraceae bacterium]|nr:vWA domain-containing protein [Tepidisphaeraceae bacterium]
MSAENFVLIHSHWSLIVGLALIALTAGFTVVRRLRLPGPTLVSFGLGALLLALAAGAPVWDHPVVEPIAVMVDLSPSTRTAEFRDPAVLQRRIAELLRDVPYRLTYFAQGTSDTAPPGRRLGDLPADHTVFSPPAAAAVLLFSDCRFAMPAQSPPTYVVIDSGLEDVDDAAVNGLEIRGNQAAVTIRNSGGMRQLVVTGTRDHTPATLPAGSVVLTRPLRAGTSKVTAELAPGDAWPENDALSIDVPPPAQLERWWVSRAGVPEGWRGISPAQLPTDPADYLAPAIIVLENLSASDLSQTQQERLRQYVRDIGGAVLILGGERAFAAGGYEGSVLDTLSPLASDPPTPTTHWVLLADASGSMSGAEAGSTRFAFVTTAIAQLLPHLPPHDLLSVGSFAESLSWWTQAQPVGDWQSRSLPPPNVFPHGATNLEQALKTIADSDDGRIPEQLLVLSDFDAQFSDPGLLQSELRAKHIRLHLLAIGEGSSLPLMRRLSASTGGAAMTQIDPKQWAQGVRELAQAAAQEHVERDAIRISFRDDAAATGVQITSTWNRVWLKSGAAQLADASLQSETIPMAAQWSDGEGQAAAVAFDPAPATIELLEKRLARSPHDPRFHVSCECGRQLSLAIDAVDDSKPLNDESISLELRDLSVPGSTPAIETVPQCGPGRYELAVPAPRSPSLATIRDHGKVIAQTAVAGRYPAEFDALGNDHAAMTELAR